MSCHRFVANRVRLALLILEYNLGNFLRRLCLPKAVKHWSLRSVQVRLIKMGGRLVRHSRRFIFQLAEVLVPRRLFQVYNGRGTAEQWIKEGKYALNWTRLSCHGHVPSSGVRVRHRVDVV